MAVYAYNIVSQQDTAYMWYFTFHTSTIFTFKCYC